MIRQVRAQVYRGIDPDIVRLYVDGRDSRDEPVILTENGWKPAPNPGTERDPTAYMDERELQKLADSLWDAGVRPSGAKGSAGQLAAVEKHLQDMRQIVSLKLATWLPGLKP